MEKCVEGPSNLLADPHRAYFQALFSAPVMVVGAHLGSIETDVDEIQSDIDRYPSFAVDSAERMGHRPTHPREIGSS
jgi:hypothetical protein